MTDAIHKHFGLSYSNYLVLHRTLMQSMPGDWQARMVACLDELNDAFAHVPQPEAFRVEAATEHLVSELDADQLEQAGITENEYDEPVPEDLGPFDLAEWREEHAKATPTYHHDATGREMDPDERVLLSAIDPVPHYNRGRTYIEPAEFERVTDCGDEALQRLRQLETLYADAMARLGETADRIDTAGVRDAARQATKACRCPHPADEHSIYGCADDCACEWMPRRAPRVGRCPVMFQGGGRCEKSADHRPLGSNDPHTPEPPAVGRQDATQPTTDETETDVTWSVVFRTDTGDTDWLTASSHYDEADRDKALSRLARRREQYPDTEFRLVRETTTWTVEDEPASGAES